MNYIILYYIIPKKNFTKFPLPFVSHMAVLNVSYCLTPAVSFDVDLFISQPGDSCHVGTFMGMN